MSEVSNHVWHTPILGSHKMLLLVICLGHLLDSQTCFLQGPGCHSLLIMVFEHFFERDVANMKLLEFYVFVYIKTHSDVGYFTLLKDEVTCTKLSL